MSEKLLESPLDGIAIVGIACKFPGAKNVNQYWDNLCSGVESISFITEDELDSSIPEEERQSSDYVMARGILDDVERFDASFFGYNSKEADIMDPQHRIFLECAWHALEHAGYNPQQVPGLVGVFAGMGNNTYFQNYVSSCRELTDSLGQTQTMILNEKDYLATNVSYRLNLKGPSLSINTACSTSLVSVCYAVDSLLHYQCDAALAGGITILFPQYSGYLFKEVSILSKDGHCRPFDADSSGTVPANGAGIVVLKRLEDAIENNDTIYGVIKGTGVTNDGSNKVSFMSPSIDGQTDTILTALEDAEVSAEDISYIEAHGTATAIGDPIEIEALTMAFRKHTSKKEFCGIGSVKSNIGHTDTAAGIAGLIKTVLALYYEKIPPSINFKSPNKDIDFQNSPFYVNKSLQHWPRTDKPRRAGVSSFGIGGTNAHIIVEEAPPQQKSQINNNPFHVLPLSAKNEKALESQEKELLNFLETNSQIGLGDIAGTLFKGRKRFNYRSFLIAHQNEDQIKTVSKFQKRNTPNQKPEVVFMFPGQGAQYLNMGKNLYETESKFRNTIDQCSELFTPEIQRDIREIIYPKTNSEEVSELLEQTLYTQPALFVVEYALAKLWLSWGITPSAMIGHSLGEYVAACLAGVFHLHDAVKMVAERAKLMQEMPPGVMMTVNCSVDAIKDYLDKDLSISAINTPKFCVVSGKKQSIDGLQSTLNKEKIGCRVLNTSHAFHSDMMTPIVKPYRDAISNIPLSSPKIPFISTAIGDWIRDDQAKDPEYWANHLRNPVLFSKGINKLWENPNRLLLEVGPRRTTSFLAMQHISDPTVQKVIPSLGDSADNNLEWRCICNVIGDLFLSGIEINWEKFHGEKRTNRIPLPLYPFQGNRHWIGDSLSKFTKRDKQVSTDKATIETFSSHEMHSFPRAGETSIESIENGKSALSYKEIRQIVIEIWRDVLPSEGPINENSDFFKNGGHSLLAVQLFMEIKKNTGVDLPLSTLFEASTPKKMAKEIENQYPRTVSIKDSYQKNKFSFLVPMQSKGSKPPVFFIHPITGNLLTYKDLVNKLGKNQPSYGLQSKGLDGKSHPCEDTRVMAKWYVEEMKLVQPHGPYYLGGHSFGGLVTFEMARQLVKNGDSVALLVLLDTYHPDFLKWVYSPSGNATYHFQELKRLAFSEKAQYIAVRIINRLKKLFTKNSIRVKILFCKLLLAIKVRLPLFLRFDYIEVCLNRAYAAYSPEPYSGRVLFVSGETYEPEKNTDPLKGWGKVLKGDVELYETSTYHVELVHDQEVAAKFKSTLTSIQIMHKESEKTGTSQFSV